MRSLVIATLAIVLAGCGSGRVSVSGKVIYSDGTPVPEGNVVGEPEGGGREGIEATISNGSFKFGSIPAGKYKIMIQCRALGDSELSEGKKPAVDSKFGKYESSGLSLDASATKNDVMFTVTRPGDKK